MQNELIIDGARFCDYGGFVEEFNRAYVPRYGDPPWDGEDIEHFHDMLEGTGDPLRVRWIDSAKSASELGHAEMAKYWRRVLANIPQWALSPAGYELLRGANQEKLNQAEAGEGRTLFEWIVFQIGDDELVSVSLE
jgi:hypothetical protein